MYKRQDWAGLRGRLAGELLLPGDRGYDAAKRCYNPLFDQRRPAAVARCQRVADVQACVAEAAATRVPIAARSGGHSYAGYSTPDAGLVVDLRGLAGVEVRADGTAVVGAGARLIDVYQALAKAGRCLPAGSCPSVGVAGLTLGGGIGVLTRKYGLTCDQLTEAEVVTADASARTVSATSEPELFWALRGGGGGNFGVVTSFTFRTAPAPDLTVFSLRFPAGSVAQVLGAWQDWCAEAPDELWTNCVITSGSPPTCRVGGCFVGSTGALAPHLDALVRAAGTTPSARFSNQLSYLNAMRYFAGCAQRSVDACHPSGEGGGQLERESFAASSSVLDQPLADPDQLVDLVTGHTDLDVLLDSLGGAVSRVGAADTAFPHRSALASVQVYAEVTDAIGPQRATSAMREVRDGLGALVGGAGYVNYIDPDLPDWATAYYGGNLDRLRRVAGSYDPDRVFAFAQGLA